MDGKINIDTVRNLLEMYFEGATSPQEEKILRKYFASERDIPEDLEYARYMFGYFADAAREVTEKTFDTSARRKHPKVRPSRRMWTWIGSAAAAAIIIAAAIPLANSDVQDDGETVYCYIDGMPITDYDLAYAYTQGALGLMEENLRKPGELLVAVTEAENHLRGLKQLGLFWDAPENECE